MATTLTPPSAPFTTTGSMLAGLGADIFAGAADIPEPVSEGVDDTPVDAAPVDETPIDAPVGDDAPADESPLDATPDVTPDASVPDVPTVDAPEDLEEGIIKSKDAKGKYKYQLDENRYAKVYGDYKMAREASDLLGEPLTLDAIKLRNDAWQAQERLFDHVTSGEPTRQADVVNFLLSEMKSAQADGETGVDPTIPFAEIVYSSLRDNAPDAYAHLRLQAARDLIGEMFELAASTGDEALGSSMGHAARALAGIGPRSANETPEAYLQRVREVTGQSQLPFYTPDEWKGLARTEDPQARLVIENAELKAQLNQRSGPAPTEQFATWNKSNSEAVNAAIFEGAVKPALSSVEESWKDWKDDYQRLVVDPLNSEVTKAIRGDQDLAQKTADLRARARRATSESVRQSIGDQIKELYVNRAKSATDKIKGPILKFAAEALQGRSATKNGRQSAAQTRTAPSGTGTPVRQSVLPPVSGFKNGVFDSATAMKQAVAALGAGR